MAEDLVNQSHFCTFLSLPGRYSINTYLCFSKPTAVVSSSENKHLYLTGSGCVASRCSTDGSRLGTPMCGAAFALITRDGDGSRFDGDGSTDLDLRPLCVVVKLKGLTTVALGS